MRYFSYNEPDNPDTGSKNSVVTVSEEHIRWKYYPYWYEQMCKKFGKEKVDERYSFEDCLKDWIVVNWAWDFQG